MGLRNATVGRALVKCDTEGRESPPRGNIVAWEDQRRHPMEVPSEKMAAEALTLTDVAGWIEAAGMY